MIATRLLPYGPDAILAEVARSELVLALQAAVGSAVGVLEVVPGARTLLVIFDLAQTNAKAISCLLSAAEPSPARPPAGQLVVPIAASDNPVVEISVRYDGADLVAVAVETGLTVAEVIRRHTAPVYTAAFCGFSPGFAYLTGLDRRLQVPRLPTPRTEVPGGSVAIAGEFAAVYPRSSPGGWRLLGTTDADLWNLSREPPALMVPGTIVRFNPA